MVVSMHYPPADEMKNKMLFDSTEVGAARRFAHRFYHQVRYCPELGAWLKYQRTIWIIVDDRALLSLIAEMVEEMKTELKQLKCDIAGQEFDVYQPDFSVMQKRALETQIAQLQRHAYAQNTLRWVSGMPEMRLGIDELDAPGRVAHLVNVLNGTIDLRTGELREPDPADYISRCFPVVYQPVAECPRFEAFISRICGDAASVEYLQCVFGAALYGQVYDEMLHILIGSGRNGKSTLCGDVMAQIFGTGKTGYAYVFEADMLTDMDSGAERPSAMRLQLRGRRLAIFKEPLKGARLNDARVKGLCSRDAITARSPYAKEPVSFEPTHTPFLLTNNLPEVKDCSRGMQRRLRILPFTVEIPDAEDDRAFGRNLVEEEREGIFNWILKGYLQWVANGHRYPTLPNKAAALTSTTMAMADKISSWLNANCLRDPKAWASSSDLFTDYCCWLTGCGVKVPPTIQQFGRDLVEAQDRLGIEHRQHPRTGNQGYQGIRLKSATAEGVLDNLIEENDLAEGEEVPY